MIIVIVLVFVAIKLSVDTITVHYVVSLQRKSVLLLVDWFILGSLTIMSHFNFILRIEII